MRILQSRWAGMLLLLAGCGESTKDHPGAAGTGGESSDPAAAASRLAETMCARQRECNGVVFELAYGNPEACLSYNAADWQRVLAAPDTGLTVRVADGCAAAHESASCDEIRSGYTAVCPPTGGSRGSGSECALDWQCESGRCIIPDQSACGTCAALGGDGEPCTDSNGCATGFQCLYVDGIGRCTALLREGSRCRFASAPSCGGNSVCVRDSPGAELGVCGPAAREGESCDTRQCENESLICNPLTNQCEAIIPAPVGASCGDRFQCAASICMSSAAGGVCSPLPVEGESCSDYGVCELGLNCVEGVCTSFDTSACN